MTPTFAAFPATRFRRMRRTAALRDLMQEERLGVADLIWPVFIRDGQGVEEPVPSMPGVARLSLDMLRRKAEEAHALGIPAICLFPYTDPALRTEGCEEAWNPDNLTNRAIRMLKSDLPDLAVMTDVALDPYNANGHDGLVRNGIILNDESVQALVRMALAQADSGADILGPSDMMDGRIGAMRSALEGAGHKDVAILSYAAKYASAFYGPFRDAVGASGRLVGDKKTYQMNPGNSDEALRRHGDGQTRDALSRHLPPGQGRLRCADLRLPGLGRIRDDPGGGRERLAGRAKGHGRKPAVLQAGRVRRHPDLFRPGHGTDAARLIRARKRRRLQPCGDSAGARCYPACKGQQSPGPEAEHAMTTFPSLPRRGLLLGLGATFGLAACANGVGSRGGDTIDARVDATRDFLFSR